MLIRPFTDSDLPSLRHLHAQQGMPYRFPDLSNPLFLTKLVVERDSQIAAALLLRLTSEAYLLLDPCAGSPRQRWQSLLLLHEAARGDAARRGLDDAHAWLPPQVARAFGRRLTQLGWQREPWPSFSRTIAAATPGL
jgi:hypothetical protein